MSDNKNLVSKISVWLALAISFGYVIGWVYRLAYLKAFDAQWLIHQYPVSDFLQSSWAPAFALFFCFFPHSIPETKDLKRISKFKIWPNLGVFFLLYLISVILIWKIWAFDFWVLYGPHVAMVGLMGWMVIMSIKSNQLKFNYSSVLMLLFTGFLVLYAMPTLLGGNRGKTDAGLLSTLPMVTLKSNNKVDTRLLLHVDDRFYVTALSKNNQKPEVSLASKEDIRSIRDVSFTSYK